MAEEFNSEFMIDYLLRVTDYTITDINKSARNYGQLCQMYRRISKCMSEYPNEIYNYYLSHNVPPEYTLEELYEMKYQELSDIRKKLGLAKKGKKVMNVEPVKKLAESTQMTIADLLENIEEPEKPDAQSEYEPQEQFLTPAEIECMYGSDYSNHELIKMGIRPEGYHPDAEKQKEEEIYLMIGTIVDLHITIAGHELTYEDCYKMDEYKIKVLYEIALHFIPEDNQKLIKRP